ncbi:MAG: hypothetical protein ABFD89_18670 [Bryobacteraceae bacterium]
MTIDASLAKRPLPSFSEWLDQRNDGKRAEGYDDFKALSDLAARTILQSDSNLPVNQASFLRLWQGLCLATVELCNIEHAKKVPLDIIVASLPRAMACGAIYAFASVMAEDAPLRDIAKVLTEEFRFAAKAAADDLMEKST